eukprot:107698-Alexandrium_andersonii.AAC.1
MAGRTKPSIQELHVPNEAQHSGIAHVQLKLRLAALTHGMAGTVRFEPYFAEIRGASSQMCGA